MDAGYDNETTKWFKEHPDAETTVMQCSACGLYYKPSLGHKCKAWQAVKSDINLESPKSYDLIVKTKNIEAGLNYLQDRAHTIREKEIINMIKAEWKKRTGGNIRK